VWAAGGGGWSVYTMNTAGGPAYIANHECCWWGKGKTDLNSLLPSKDAFMKGGG